MTYRIKIINNKSYPLYWYKFINHWIFLCIRQKIEKQLSLVIFFWKRYFNLNFFFFFFEALNVIKPVLGYRIYVIKKKNRKKLIKIYPFLLNSSLRINKGIFWLYKGIKFHTDKMHIFKIINEIYNILYLEKSFSLDYKLKHYNYILLHKASKNYLW